MRYFLNVYRTRFVYTGLRFYTAWADSGRSARLSVPGCCLQSNQRVLLGVLSQL